MRGLVVVAVLLGAVAPARADSVALLVSETRAAHDAAANGNCQIVVSIGVRMQASAIDYYRTAFLADPAIAACIERPSQPDSTQREGTSYLPLRIAGELVVGGVLTLGGGIGGLALGAEAGGDLYCDRDSPCNEGPLKFGVTVGAVVAAPLGVYLIGTLGSDTGSFPATALGSLVGVVPGLVVLGVDDDYAFPFLLSGPLVGAIVGFNLTRRDERDTASVAAVPMVRIDHGQSTFGIAGAF